MSTNFWLLIGLTAAIIAAPFVVRRLCRAPSWFRCRRCGLFYNHDGEIQAERPYGLNSIPTAGTCPVCN